MKTFNPFILGHYESSEYFCDRKKEIKRIENCFKNNRNLTIISHRKLGKTGLIMHFFSSISKQKNTDCFYIDLMHTSSSEEFIQALAKAVIGKFDNKTTRLLKSFTSIVKSIRPSITIDSMTGEPTIDITLHDQFKKETTIEEIFSYLQQQDRKIVIAFDEFQQIGNYPENNMEALLRGHIQQMQNTVFIFSGSQKHLLLSMFGDYQRPFYQSTEILNLEKIDRNTYLKFIIAHFENRKRTVDTDAVNMILDLTEVHTYYVQFLCNKLFSLNVRKITTDLVVKTMLNILNEQEVVYYNYRNLLTTHQFELLKAIAVETKVHQPMSKDFLRKHNLSAASTIATNLDSLIHKEMIYYDQKAYKIYDVFFAQWLRRY